MLCCVAGIRVRDELPSFAELATHIVGCTVLDEVFFYYAHRLLHTPFLYEHVHKVHHEYKTPFVAMTLFHHPVESLLGTCVV